MAKKRKTPTLVVAAPPPEPVAPPLPSIETGDAIHQVAKDMLSLQEAITEKLAMVKGVRVSNPRPLTLAVPAEEAKKLSLPNPVICPELLSPKDRVDTARLLGVDMRSTAAHHVAWKHLYGLDI